MKKLFWILVVLTVALVAMVITMVVIGQSINPSLGIVLFGICAGLLYGLVPSWGIYFTDRQFDQQYQAGEEKK